MSHKVLIVRNPPIGFSHLAHLESEVTNSLWLLCRRWPRRPTEWFMGFSPNAWTGLHPSPPLLFPFPPSPFWDHLPVFFLHRSPKEKISKDFLWESTLAFVNAKGCTHWSPPRRRFFNYLVKGFVQTRKIFISEYVT